MIIFTALIELKEGTNLEIVPGGLRFSPNLEFDLVDFEGQRFGLTIVAPDSVITSGSRGRCTITMLDDPAFLKLANAIKSGTRFKLSQGPIPLGSGIVDHVRERTIGEGA